MVQSWRSLSANVARCIFADGIAADANAGVAAKTRMQGQMRRIMREIPQVKTSLGWYIGNSRASERQFKRIVIYRLEESGAVRAGEL